MPAGSCETGASRGRQGGAGLKLLVLLAALFSFVALAWMVALPRYIEGRVTAETGFPCSVATLMCNPFAGRIQVAGLTVENPVSFPAPGFVRLRRLEGELSLISYFTDQWVMDDLDVDVERLDLVTDWSGRSNAAAFSAALASRPQTGAPKRSWLVRRLRLRIDTLGVRDGRSGGVAKEYRLGIDHTFTSISSPAQLLVPSLLRSLGPAETATGFSRWVPGGFGAALGTGLQGLSLGGLKVLKQAGSGARRGMGDLFHALEQSVKP